MSTWKTSLKSEEVNRKKYIILDDLVLVDDEFGEITVPKGFVTDYASVSVLQNLLLAPIFVLVADYGDKAATVHDYLYTQAKLSRKECDQVLYRALLAEGLEKWRATLFWLGVRVGGGSHFGA
ncbi:hypothetical protein D3C87_1499730 [compost metagenome]